MPAKLVMRTCSCAMSVGMGVISFGMSASCRLGMQFSASGGSGVSCSNRVQAITKATRHQQGPQVCDRSYDLKSEKHDIERVMLRFGKPGEK